MMTMVMRIEQFRRQHQRLRPRGVRMTMRVIMAMVMAMTTPMRMLMRPIGPALGFEGLLDRHHDQVGRRLRRVRQQVGQLPPAP